MSTENRRYEQRRRAQSVAETRRRITEAAVELHGALGPARTTLSDVAERAGVTRQTLYRHFPTEEHLLDACSALFWTSTPPPDASAWRSLPDPGERLVAGLTETYAYYEEVGPMLANVLRDRPLSDAIDAHMAPFEMFQEQALAVMSSGWGARGGKSRLVRAAVRHALAFATWDSLTREGGLGRDEAVCLASALVREAAGR